MGQRILPDPDYRPSILIADDEPDNFLYLEILLKNFAGKIIHAENGLRAVELASACHFDLVLMDLKMPEMNGIEATKILKTRFPHLHIIGQTACATREEWDSAMEAGCDELIIKPIRRRELIASLEKYLTVPT